MWLANKKVGNRKQKIGISGTMGRGKRDVEYKMTADKNNSLNLSLPGMAPTTVIAGRDPAIPCLEKRFPCQSTGMTS